MLLTAPRIHDGHHFLPPGSALEVDDRTGTVLAIRTGEGARGARHYPGVLCPAFINAHCHLELSHLAGLLPRGTGLVPFLRGVVAHRAAFTEAQKREARRAAAAALHRAGTAAVADIANTPDTAELRAAGAPLHIHTFVECIGFHPAEANARFAAAKAVEAQFAAAPLAPGRIARQSVVPHAPYSVSEALMRRIGSDGEGILSIHNEESPAETAWFANGTGPVRDLLAGLGLPLEGHQPTSAPASLPVYGAWLPKHRRLLLVHDTCTTEATARWAIARFPKLHWVLCPGANLYIEGRLPDVPALLRAGADLCLGTDSLASNDGLSILAEAAHLHRAFPNDAPWEALLRWATSSGARALEMDDVIGSFAPGKRPGVLHLTPDFSAVQEWIVPHDL